MSDAYAFIDACVRACLVLTLSAFISRVGIAMSRALLPSISDRHSWPEFVS